MNQSGISADANGQYKITPISSALSESLDHYMVRVDISVDGAIRSGYVALIQQAPEYEIDGVLSLDSSAMMRGSFWVTANEQIKTSGLGTASYTVYDSSGAVALVIPPNVGGVTSTTQADGVDMYTPPLTKISAILYLRQRWSNIDPWR